MNGWTEDESTDVRTRDLNRRRDDLLAGTAKVWSDDGTYIVRPLHAHPRRIDWARVAAIVVVIGAAALTLLGIYAVIVYVLTAF
jgi:hypothetical protein